MAPKVENLDANIRKRHAQKMLSQIRSGNKPLKPIIHKEKITISKQDIALSNHGESQKRMTLQIGPKQEKLIEELSALSPRSRRPSQASHQSIKPPVSNSNIGSQTVPYFDPKSESMTRIVKFDEKAQSAILAAEIEAMTKGTQFPELVTEHEHEAFWYQDKTNRLKR